MIFDFLKKQKKAKEKLKLTQIAIINLQIPEAQKSLYLQAIEVLDEEGINKIYSTLVNFIETVEMKQLDEIQKNNFSIVA
jgi:hypothetical protein